MLTQRRQGFVALAALTVLALVACGGSADRPDAVSVPPAPADITPPAAEPDGASAGMVLASGTFELPGAAGIADAPGFHEELTDEGMLPVELSATAGATLVLSLRDASRPNVTCDSEHPLSGCATVDWADFEDRPRVPASGAFEQRLELAVAGGTQTFFLSESGALNAEPDPYAPG